MMFLDLLGSVMNTVCLPKIWTILGNSYPILRFLSVYKHFRHDDSQRLSFFLPTRPVCMTDENSWPQV